MKTALCALLFFGITLTTYFQRFAETEIILHNTCGYTNTLLPSYQGSPASPAIEKLVARMIGYTGFDDRINVFKSRSIESAVIGLNEQDQVTLLVNEQFLGSDPKSPRFSFLAHELGHLFRRHLFEKKDLPIRQKELSADVFSGFWGQRAGIRLDDMTSQLDDIRSDTIYPSVQERKDSVGSGYRWAAKPFRAENWLTTDKSAAKYEECLSVFVTVTPSARWWGFFGDNMFRVIVHLTSTNINIPIANVVKEIRHVTYDVDSTFKHPSFISTNPNDDNFGYMFTSVTQAFPIFAIIRFKDTSVLSIEKKFTLK